MDNNLIATRSIEIFAHLDKVWDALINPDKMKTYFFASEVKADWKEDGELLLQVNKEGGSREEKGKVLEYKPKESIKYKYWRDYKNQKEENHTITSYQLEQVTDASVKLTWSEEGFADEDQKQRKEDELPQILNQIKLIVEKEEHGNQ
ncbi:MAG TPA: SRPBCC domain-containing protein [Anditalea sp.]|nr:SRPBCC domain-containing protein [Anditalea sp.]